MCSTGLNKIRASKPECRGPLDLIHQSDQRQGSSEETQTNRTASAAGGGLMGKMVVRSDLKLTGSKTGSRVTSEGGCTPGLSDQKSQGTMTTTIGGEVYASPPRANQARVYQFKIGRLGEMGSCAAVGDSWTGEGVGASCCCALRTISPGSWGFEESLGACWRGFASCSKSAPRSGCTGTIRATVTPFF